MIIIYFSESIAWAENAPRCFLPGVKEGAEIVKVERQETRSLRPMSSWCRHDTRSFFPSASSSGKLEIKMIKCLLLGVVLEEVMNFSAFILSFAFSFPASPVMKSNFQSFSGLAGWQPEKNGSPPSEPALLSLLSFRSHSSDGEIIFRFLPDSIRRRRAQGALLQRIVKEKLNPVS